MLCAPLQLWQLLNGAEIIIIWTVCFKGKVRDIKTKQPLKKHQNQATYPSLAANELERNELFFLSTCTNKHLVHQEILKELAGVTAILDSVQCSKSQKDDHQRVDLIARSIRPVGKRR